MNPQSHVELKPNRNIPDFRPGDTVRVHAKVIEGDRERIQVFEGVVIRIRRRGPASSFTVRRISHGIGVERIFPYYSPLVEKVEVSRVGKVRRAKLYYLRGRIGKAARIRAGERERFEALTAALPPEEPEVDEEEIIAADLEAAAAAEEAGEAVEGEETTAEAGAEVTAEATEAPADEPAAEEPDAEEETPAEAEPEVKAQEETAAEGAPEEPAAEEPEMKAEEVPAAEEDPATEEPAAEQTPAEEEESKE